MKKIILFTMVLVSMMFIACSKQDTSMTNEPTEVVVDIASDEPVKIIFWHSLGGEANGAAVARIIDGFNASQDKVIVESQFQGTYDDAITKLKSSSESAYPDIMQLYDVGTRWMIDSGLSHTMQDYINADNYDISDYEENILAYYSIDGTLHSMPFNCSSPVLIYNKTALDALGLDATTAFSTLEAAEETANKLANVEGIEVGGSLTNYSWVVEQLIGMQGKELMNNGNGRESAPTAVAADQNGAFETLLTAYKSAANNPNMRVWGKGTAESKSQFATGTVGYIYDSSSIYVSTALAAKGKFEIGFASLPKVDENLDGGVSVGGGSLWMMDSGDSDRAAAAWAFIKYATSSEVQAQFAIDTGYLPIRTSAAELDFFVDYATNVNKGMMVTINSLRNSKPQYAGALMGVFPSARVIIENEIETLYGNPSKDVNEVIESIASDINAEVEMYNLANF